uniref:Putative secreted protein n=1 Tax=Anopheles darlingi TaxID=43151 RepID=A0A2M4CJ36_ANODA
MLLFPTSGLLLLLFTLLLLLLLWLRSRFARLMLCGTAVIPELTYAFCSIRIGRQQRWRGVFICKSNIKSLMACWAWDM